MTADPIASARIKSGWLWAVGLYLLLRIILAPIAASVADVVPSTPDAPPLSSSTLQNTLINPWHRWDVVYYRSIVAEGYGTDPATTNFHPLYAWFGWVWGVLTGGNWTLGLLLASGVATIGLYLLIARLAHIEAADNERWTAVVLTLLPGAFILYAPYSESLFLVFAVACLLLARAGRWTLAGAMGLGASLTRQQGIVLVLPLLWEMAQAAGGWRALLRRVRWLTAAMLPLVGLGLVIVYRTILLGGLPDRWWLPQNWIYAVLISPTAQEVVPGQRFVPPWTALWLAVDQLLHPTEFTASWLPRALDLATGAIYLLLLAAFWRRLRPAYRVYCAAIYLLAFAYHTGPLFAYMGLSRHLLLAFPLALPLAQWASIFPRRLLVVLIGSLLVLGQTVLYVAHAWVP